MTYNFALFYCSNVFTGTKFIATENVPLIRSILAFYKSGISETNESLFLEEGVSIEGNIAFSSENRFHYEMKQNINMEWSHRKEGTHVSTLTNFYLFQKH